MNAFDKNGQPVYMIDGKPLIKVDDRLYPDEIGNNSELLR